jgi:hypothetical protein
MRVLHVLTILAAFAAGLVLVFGVGGANGAPQEAAAAAIAVGIAVIPYVGMRAFDASRGEQIEVMKRVEEALKAHTGMLAYLANAQHHDEAKK